MFRSLWAKFFVLLLVVSAVSLSASLYLRQMMLSDFEQYLEGEMLDRVYQVTASLEGSYEQWDGWNERQVRREVVRALMMGMVTRVLDSSGKELIDAADAVEGLTPLMKRRVLSLVDMNTRTPSGEFIPYPLFLGGERIGTFEVHLFPRARAGLFMERSIRFLLIAFLTMGGLAVVGSLLVSRKLTSPLKRLEEQARSIREGDFTGRVDVSGVDEIGRLSHSFNEMADELQVLETLRKKAIANVAHELRTPVAVMRGELEGMIDGVILPDERQFVSLQEEITRLTKILDGIDDLTQAQASSLDLAPRKLSLATFLADLIERSKNWPSSENIDIFLEVNHESEAWVDPDRFGQIMVNLLSNAFKATPPGGTVTIRANSDGDRTLVKIEDTGRGINTGDLPHIFERFYRGAEDSQAGARGTETGLGLGLSIVKELVDAHRGGITVTSEKGRGTVVTVILPVGSVDAKTR
jgi:two-component system sensor histidine kinase BaeS